jgi:predicted RecB family nuclease
MRIHQGQLVLSPSDLSNFLACRHRAGLDLAVAQKVMTRPAYSNPYAAILQRHGEEHEDAYVESIRAGVHTLVNARPDDKTTPDQSSAITVDAMRRGVDAIVQARLEKDRLAGYADILYRVERPSALGNWSYEAHDTKLTRDTKGGTILQLSAYSHLLGEMQGAVPEYFHVVTPVATERYRVADYAAYHRMVHRTLLQELAKGHEQLIAEHYPEPVEACQVCVWEARCEARRRKDDHLSYIAGSGRSHRVELTAQNIPDADCRRTDAGAGDVQTFTRGS